jgi:predicted transcriptional regulator
MNTMDLETSDAPPPETVADRERRIAREAGELTQARASAAAGRVVESAKVKAWIDSIGTDHEMPVPYSEI